MGWWGRKRERKGRAPAFCVRTRCLLSRDSPFVREWVGGHGRASLPGRVRGKAVGVRGLSRGSAPCFFNEGEEPPFFVFFYKKREWGAARRALPTQHTRARRTREGKLQRPRQEGAAAERDAGAPSRRPHLGTRTRHAPAHTHRRRLTWTSPSPCSTPQSCGARSSARPVGGLCVLASEHTDEGGARVAAAAHGRLPFLARTKRGPRPTPPGSAPRCSGRPTAWLGFRRGKEGRGPAHRPQKDAQTRGTVPRGG